MQLNLQLIFRMTNHLVITWINLDKKMGIMILLHLSHFD